MAVEVIHAANRLGINYFETAPGYCKDRRQYEKAKGKGQCGISSHLSSEGLKKVIDDGIFEFMMVPYNAINFGHREEAEWIREEIEPQVEVKK